VRFALWIVEPAGTFAATSKEITPLRFAFAPEFVVPQKKFWPCPLLKLPVVLS